jgi:hypothetical protein
MITIIINDIFLEKWKAWPGRGVGVFLKKEVGSARNAWISNLSDIHALWMSIEQNFLHVKNIKLLNIRVCMAVC